MTDTNNVLVVTIGGNEDLYERGRHAIRQLEASEPVERPATITCANEQRLGEVFKERTYKLLRVIRENEPRSIRETARLVDRDVKNVHEELSTLEALGVIRFDEEGQAKRPVFPYDDLVISPFGEDENDTAAATT
jgi:predicted transcriptional regulator